MTAQVHHIETGDRSKDTAAAYAAGYRCTECRVTATITGTVGPVHKPWCLRAARLRQRRAAAKPRRAA